MHEIASPFDGDKQSCIVLTTRREFSVVHSLMIPFMPTTGCEDYTGLFIAVHTLHILYEITKTLHSREYYISAEAPTPVTCKTTLVTGEIVHHRRVSLIVVSVPVEDRLY